MALVFAILLVKATLGAKCPESICFWLSFAKNRTQSSRPSVGKKLLVKPFYHCPVATPVGCPGSQRCFLLKRPRSYSISDGEFLMSKLFWKLSSSLPRFLENWELKEMTLNAALNRKEITWVVISILSEKLNVR